MSNTGITPPSEETGVSFVNTQTGVELVLLAGTDGKEVRYAALFPDGAVRIETMPTARFNEVAAVLHVAPAVTAAAILKKASRIGAVVLDALEEVIDMKTKGKTAAQLGAEVARVAKELPKGHPLHSSPSQYKNRADAIAALTAVKQELFAINQPKSQPKEQTMTKKAETKKPADKSAAATEDKKPAAAATEAAKPAEAGTAAAAPAADDKKKAKATKGAKALAGKAEAKAKKAKGRDGLTDSTFTLGKAVGKAKTPEELRMHEGSARYKVMEYVLGSKKASFAYEDIEKVAGEQALQSISLCVKKGYLAVAKAA
jgi:hypothetical protein